MMQPAGDHRGVTSPSRSAGGPPDASEPSYAIPLALRSLGNVDADAYRRWVVHCIVIALAAYSVVALAGWMLGSSDRYTLATQSVAWLACATALGLALSGRIEQGSTLALAAIWFDLQAGLHRTGMIAPGVIALPALVVVAGFLYGGRTAFIAAAATSFSVGTLAIGVHRLAGDAVRPFPAEAYSFLVLVATLFVVAALIHVAMRALNAAVARDFAARRLQEARAADARRLDAIGQLAGGIAHEFNNQLTVIGVSAELLLQDSNPETREAASSVLEAQSRASLLTAELVAFADKEVVIEGPVCLTDVLSGARSLLETLAGPHVSLDQELRPTPDVLADPRQVTRVAASLVNQARDSLGGHGSITLSVLGPGDRRDAVLGDDEVPSGVVELRVEDRGKGMSAERLRRLRQPFLDSDTPGWPSALGHVALQRIAIQDGGGVLIDGEEGVGTCVRVRWPVVRPD